jgi:soluble lytic murein transglycosylase-like protein
VGIQPYKSGHPRISLAGKREPFSIDRMKRTFCLLAMMAAPAISPEARAKVPPSPLRQLRLEFIQAYVEEAAAKERLEPALLRAVIKVESNFNHKAESPVGAKGLMQMMPATAQEVASAKALDSRNPRANVMAGARYLRSLINQFSGDLRLALAAYNAGPGAVLKHKGVPPYRETQAYVTKVMGELESQRLKVIQEISRR